VEHYQVKWGREILAVILPALAAAVLVIFGAIALGIVIAIAASGEGG
jgi:hypothetical protein